MKKILIVGDFKGNTGPASVNKTIKNLYQEIHTTKCTSRITRILEFGVKAFFVDYIIFSGFSKLNIIGFKIAKILNKKNAYLMHGSVEFESKINNECKEDRILLEKKMLNMSPKVICVSKLFMEFMRKNSDEPKEKFCYVNNPLDLSNFKNNPDIKKDENLIMSVGGGLPQKNILAICEAINIINKRENAKYRLLVIGKNGQDTEKIKKFDFVEYKENVPYEDIKIYYSKANLYIQNSSFETFGLAPIEALLCGCKILISNQCGCKDSIVNITKNNLIYLNTDISEISNKIKFMMQNKNDLIKYEYIKSKKKWTTEIFENLEF
ncbi:MAG: glycosyltransferase family 4 protein [Sarcina sp.]